MYRNPIAIFFINFIPGFGHLAVNRKGRAVVYPLLFFGILGGGLMLSVAASEEGPFVVGLILAVCIWIINMIDIIIYLLRHPIPQVAGTAYYSGAAGEGPAGGIGAMETPAMQAHSSSAYGFDPAAGGAGMGRASVQPGGSAQGTEAGERFFTILLSMIPGLGHLQLGLMQRGLTLLVGFFGLLTMIVFVSVLTDQPGFLAFLGALPIIWLYGMVDAIRLVGRKQRGETIKDTTILEDWDSHRENGRRSRLVATLLSLFPGAGHMYLGLQRRGLQLMAGFLFSIYLLDALHLTLFLFLVPIIWFYAFFDGLQQTSKYESGELVDEPVINWLMNRQKWVGIGLLALGVYYLFDQLALDWIQEFFDSYELTRQIERYVQTGLVAVLLIGGGVKLLIGSGRKRGRS
ncbi:hypothetical protein AB6A23_01955 [Paenibacillus tarimensis]